MRKSLTIGVGFLSLALIVAGCASIVSKSSYPVVITSQPDQASISIVNQTGKTILKGTTPTTVTLETKAGYFSGNDYTVTFEKAGYATHTSTIRRGVDGWYIAGNLVFGGLIGWLIVDPLTGAMWTLEKECHATLHPMASSHLNDNTLTIVSLDDVPASLRSKLKRLNAR